MDEDTSLTTRYLRRSPDAEAAIEYLLALFEGRNNCVKAMTTKGSFLTSLRFATEQTKEDPLDTRTNDDLILSCCLLFIDGKADGM